VLHWIVPNIGVALAAAGIITSMQTVTAYIADAYGIYAASAVAAITVLRSFAGFGKQYHPDCYNPDHSMTFTICRLSVICTIYV
jgi:hypothetical protein